MTTEAYADSHSNEKDNTYNGWKNRETWALNLWFNNDSDLYYSMRHYIQNLQDHGVPKENAITYLADWFEKFVDKQVNNIRSSVIKDMISFEVDYYHVAESNLEDYGEVE